MEPVCCPEGTSPAEGAVTSEDLPDVFKDSFKPNTLPF